MAEKNDILDIVRGISTAAARGYDGALDSDGQPLKIGLKREEGDPVLDKRIIDGFKASIAGNMLIIKYQAEIMLKDVYKGDFEGEVEQRMRDIVSFLKKCDDYLYLLRSQIHLHHLQCSQNHSA